MTQPGEVVRNRLPVALLRLLLGARQAERPGQRQQPHDEQVGGPLEERA
jgi:hypothetical protein